METKRRRVRCRDDADRSAPCPSRSSSPGNGQAASTRNHSLQLWILQKSFTDQCRTLGTTPPSLAGRGRQQQPSVSHSAPATTVIPPRPMVACPVLPPPREPSIPVISPPGSRRRLPQPSSPLVACARTAHRPQSRRCRCPCRRPEPTSPLQKVAGTGKATRRPRRAPGNSSRPPAPASSRPISAMRVRPCAPARQQASPVEPGGLRTHCVRCQHEVTGFGQGRPWLPGSVVAPAHLVAPARGQVDPRHSDSRHVRLLGHQQTPRGVRLLLLRPSPCPVDHQPKGRLSA